MGITSHIGIKMWVIMTRQEVGGSIVRPDIQVWPVQMTQGIIRVHLKLCRVVIVGMVPIHIIFLAMMRIVITIS